MAKQKKLTRAEKEALPKSSELKIRVIEVKERLPRSGVSTLFFHYFKGEYSETVKNKSRLNNVLQCRITDKEITEKLEELANLLTKTKEN